MKSWKHHKLITFACDDVLPPSYQSRCPMSNVNFKSKALRNAPGTQLRVGNDDSISRGSD